MEFIKTVKSESDPTKTYKLYKLPDGRIICTCKGFEFREYCRHVKTYSLEEYAKRNKRY